jgi:hypothetical protein
VFAPPYRDLHHVRKDVAGRTPRVLTQSSARGPRDHPALGHRTTAPRGTRRCCMMRHDRGQRPRSRPGGCPCWSMRGGATSPRCRSARPGARPGLHLARLEAAHDEVYGRALSGQEVRDRIRHALWLTGCQLRVYGYWAGLIVTVRGPQDTPDRLHSMTAMQFQRPLARLKHVGSWSGAVGEAAVAAGLMRACWWTTGRIPRARSPTWVLAGRRSDPAGAEASGHHDADSAAPAGRGRRRAGRGPVRVQDRPVTTG